MWARGCVAKSLCDRYQGRRIEGEESSMNFYCCHDGSLCNDHDYIGGGNTPGTGAAGYMRSSATLLTVLLLITLTWSH